ncbi:MAG: DUF6734 family protein [Bacteroidales bacterium]
MKDNNLHFVHSFRTLPMTDWERWSYSDTLIKNAWYFSWSVLSIKKYYPNATINLHTDNVGQELLGLLPYDNIYNTLEDIDIPKYLWAGGKFEAIKNEPLGTIHIDGDVIIFGNQFSKLLDGDYDVVVQSYDGNYPTETKRAEPILKFNPSYFGKGAFNCGLVGINNQELKDKYYNSYMEMVNLCKMNSAYTEPLFECKNKLCFDLLFEQNNLYKLCSEGGYNIHTLFNSVRTMQVLGKKSGFLHFLGQEKYKTINLEKARNAVKKLDIDVYNYLLGLENTIEEEVTENED